MLSNADLLAQYHRHVQESDTQMRRQHSEAQDDHAFCAGDSMNYTGSVEDKGSKREVIFNKVEPYIDAVLGTMIQIRRKPDYTARIMENAAMQQYSEYMNNLSETFRKKANLDQIETLQDREMLVCGYGAVDTNIGYETDHNGSIVAECLRFDDVFFDPMAQETNMNDGRFVRRRKPFSRTEAEERFSDTPINEFEAYDGMKGASQYYPDGGEYDKIQPDGTNNFDLVQVNYYQWWELQPYWRMENPAGLIDDPEQRAAFLELLGNIEQARYDASDSDELEDMDRYSPTDEYLCLTQQQYNDVKRVCEEFGITPKAVKQNKKVYYTALITDKHVMRKFKSPAQDGFTIKFKTAKYDPVNRLWYGMVRALKKPAEYANKALTEMLYIIAATSKAGVLYEEDAVVDPRRFEEQYATTKAAIRVNSGALSQGKIQPKGQPAMNSGYEMVLQYANSSIGEVTGINSEFIGNAQNKQASALLESQRINQVMASLATYFDSITLYQLEHARMMVTFIRMLAQNSMGRLIKIVGQDGAQRYEQMTEERMVDEYDIDINESPTTPAQKEQTTQIMMEFADKFAQMAVAAKNPSLAVKIYSSSIRWLPIKLSEQQELIKSITPDPQQEQAQAQAAQQQQQVEAQMNEAIRQGTMAKAARDLADKSFIEAKTMNELADVGVTHAEVGKTKADTVKALADAGEKHHSMGANIANTHADTYSKLKAANEPKEAAAA